MSLIRIEHRSILPFLTSAIFAFTAVTLFGAVFSSPAMARGGGFRGGGGLGGARGGAGGFSRPSGGFSGMSMARPNVSSGTYSRGSVSSANVNRANVNRARVNTGNVNVNTGNINVSGGYYHGWDDYPTGAAFAGAVTGAAIGAAAATPSTTYVAPTTVYSLPPSCTPVVVNGTTYQNCAGTYYAPTYQGTSIAYQPVPPP